MLRRNTCTVSIACMPAFLRSPHLLLTITAFIWAGNAIAGKFAIDHISPMVLTLMRWWLALAILLAIAWPVIWQERDKLRQHWLYLLLLGAFGYTGFNFLLYTALIHTSAINVTLEQSAMPLIIFIVNFVLYRIAVRWLQIVGFAITACGVLVTATYGDPLSLLAGNPGALNRGDLFMLGAALLYALYSVALKQKPEMKWQTFLAGLVLGGAIAAVPGAAIETAMGVATWPTTLQGLLVALYAGIFPSLVSQGFFIRGVEALGANAAGLYINLVPIFAAILAILLLGEEPRLFHAIAFALVVGGILLAQFGERKDKTPADTK